MGFGDIAAPIVARGRASVATLAFRLEGELRVAVVVKATFAMVPNGPMTPAETEPIVRADGSWPGHGLSAATDLVPYRPRADVLLFGSARAPEERPTPAMGVRLMIAQGSEVVLDKRLVVRGALQRGSREPTPFSAQRIAWESAARTAENPVGVVETASNWPLIVDPRHLDRAAGFGPIAPSWPSRRALAPASVESLLQPIPSLLRGFAWEYFHAAPADQRITFLRGDEWIGFEGMHAHHARVQSSLPGVRASARVYPPMRELDAGLPLPLDADTLVIDADRLTCSVVWRGAFPVRSEAELASYRVVAGVEARGERLAFPASRAEVVASPVSLGNATVAFDRSAFVPRASATPFVPASAAPPTAGPAAPQADGGATVAVDPDALRRALSAVTPFVAPASPDAPPSVGATVDLDPALVRRMLAATPFDPGPPRWPERPTPEVRRADPNVTIALEARSSHAPSAATPFEEPRGPVPPPAPSPPAAPASGSARQGKSSARPRVAAAPSTIAFDSSKLAEILGARALPFHATPQGAASQAPTAATQLPPPAPSFDALTPVSLLRPIVVEAETIGQRAAHASEAQHGPAPVLSGPPLAPAVDDGPIDVSTLGGLFLAAMKQHYGRLDLVS